MAKKSSTKKTTTKKTSTKASTKTTAKRSTKQATKAKPSKKAKSKVNATADADEISDGNDPIVEVNRRENGDRRQEEASVNKDRRKVQRRRQIDPTTCERDYSNDEIEFMQAMDEYKRDNGRMFPTCSEILEVVRSIGYQKMPLGPQALSSDVVGATELAVAEADDDFSEIDELATKS